MAKIDISTDWEPHSPEQRSILVAPERVIDVTCGRRFGKTATGRAWVTGIHPDASPDLGGAVWIPGSRTWYAAPTYNPACLDFYRGLKESLGGLLKDKSDSHLRLKLFNDAVIECKSLERPDTLLGVGLDRLLIDEKGTVSSEAWYRVLAPMLADPPERCERRVMRIGTPRGRKHWTFKEHMDSLGGKHGRGGRVAFQFPTWTRPGIADFVEDMRRSLPSKIFEQEIGAQFIADAAGYFMGVGAAHDGLPAPLAPLPNERHTAGVDLAHSEDWTVVVVIRAHPKPMRVVHVERFARVDFSLTRSRIATVLRKWNADALFDATPGGFPSEVGVEAFRAGDGWKRIDGFDSRAKEGGRREDALAALSVAIEQGELKFPGTHDAPVFPVLTAELDGFEFAYLANGKHRAQAGPGLSDDAVFSLALAVWRARNLTTGGYASRKHW